ncbi:hypothetical protein K432DRAFT_444679 [Lepidopterella palustris CBS 459.81]|uniref:C2H2-type domain-containing protein n=1 Tax=Lepidopterella palustris CBS 459.81 TaxID=1314670 RepID=A0A8E2E726_9PEZI|nr:hypothetical protein K432DRAFT_444679 [Lepidopterella palustris CBS 459.81]
MDNFPDASHVNFTNAVHSDFGEMQLDGMDMGAKSSCGERPRLIGQIPYQFPGDFPGLHEDLIPELPSLGLFHDPAFDPSLASYNSGTSFCEDAAGFGWPELAPEILGVALAPVQASQRTIGDLSGQEDLPATSTNLRLALGHYASSSSSNMPSETLHTGNSDTSWPAASRFGPESASHNCERVRFFDNVPGGCVNDQTDTTTTEGLKCKWPGCRSNKTFKRKYEYNRHMKKHTRTVSLPCPVVYCPRQGSRSFYRWDKLFDHLRTGHTEDETCRCLVDGCTAPQMPLNLLRLHARYHDVDINKHPNLATSCDFLKILRSFSTARKCDLKKCKRWLSADETGSLQEHLLRHPLDDRRSQSEVIEKMGYDPITAEIVCPLCQQHFTDSVQFAPHLETTHLTTDPAHWLSFKHHVPADSPAAARYIWRGWENKEGASEDCYCRHCGDYASSQSNKWIDHHLGLLAMSNEIRVARPRILRLLPAFADHPVFKADMPTVHRAACLKSGVEEEWSVI